MNIKILLISSVFLLSGSSCDSKKKSESNSEEKSVSSDEQSNSFPSMEKYILFFGNSLTAGYGLEENQSFPSLIQLKLEELQYPYKVINAGLSGETSSNGADRIDWILKQDIDVFVLELGANDMLRGLDVSQTETNLRKILNKVKNKHEDTALIIAGMKAAPNMGQDYVKAYDEIFPRLAKEFGAGLIPFLLEGVASDPELNLNDGKHPNEEGQKIVAETVWKILLKYLEK